MALYLKSKRGGRKLIYENYEYVKETARPPKVYWQCSKKGECKARAHTENDQVVKIVNVHTHAPNAAKVEADFAYDSMKVAAATSGSSNQLILGTHGEQMSEAALAQLPTKDTIKRTLRKKKAMAHQPLPLPRSLEEMVIPDEYKSTLRGDLFLQQDSGANDPERFLIFATARGLQLLGFSKTWFMDGTFTVVPKIFYQLYTIHVQFMDSVVPVIFVLMAKKSQEAYEKVFFGIKNLCPDASPTCVMSDFEIAAINAVKATYPNCNPRGCFFHFSQCIYRKIQEFGLQQRYTDDQEFLIQCKMISAIAAVPNEHVTEAFEALRDYLPICLENVLDYFEDNFIGRLGRRERRVPRFPISFWCHHDTILNENPKTTNPVEAWHRGLQANVSAHHPTIWKFLNALRREESLTLMRIEQLNLGIKESKKKVYQNIATRLRRIAENFQANDLLQYLRGVAHNISF